MSPVEGVFLVMLIFFAVSGVVRGYTRELGVTTMLLLALFVIELIEEKYRVPFEKALTVLSGSGASIANIKALLFCGIVIVITFISYQGETLSFPGKGKSVAFSLGTGLINGYLFAGSLWYYLQAANWLQLPVTKGYTPFYQLVVKFLPPAVFSWPYLIGLAVLMLIMRVWK